MENKKHSTSVWSEIEPYCVIKTVLKNLWMVVLAAVAFSMLAYIAVTLMMKPTYTSSVIFVATPKNALSSGNATISTSTADQFSSLLSGTMLRKQIQQEYGSAVDNVTVSAKAVSGTSVIKVNATAQTPSAAYYMTSGIVEHYAEWTPYLMNTVVLEVVNAPNIPSNDEFLARQRRIVLIAAPIGALLMTALLCFLCFISRTVQTTVGARNQVDAPLLVTIRHERRHRTLKSLLSRKKASLLISNPTTAFSYVETVHQLRARVEHAKKHHGCKAFLITSVSENEGKSTLAANLALCLAKRYKKVLLVDCDMRKATQSQIFGMKAEQSKSLNALLKGELDPSALVHALQYRKSDNLFCLFSSVMRHNTSALLGSVQMRQILKVLRENFDYVIVDTPPMGYFTDSALLADQTDASILVLRQDKVTDLAANDTIDALRRCNARFLGFVFNDVHTLNLATRLLGGRHGYGYGYGYSSGYEYGYGKRGYSKNGYGYGYGYGSKGYYGSGKERIDDEPAQKGEDSDGTT